jgi:hypothetical protein
VRDTCSLAQSDRSSGEAGPAVPATKQLACRPDLFAAIRPFDKASCTLSASPLLRRHPPNYSRPSAASGPYLQIPAKRGQPVRHVLQAEPTGVCSGSVPSIHPVHVGAAWVDDLEQELWSHRRFSGAQGEIPGRRMTRTDEQQRAPASTESARQAIVRASDQRRSSGFNPRVRSSILRRPTTKSASQRHYSGTRRDDPDSQAATRPRNNGYG